MRKASREIKILTLLLLPIIAIAVMHHIVTGFTIYNDGIGYYVYGRSLLIDSDLNFTNEYNHYENSYSKFSSMPLKIGIETITAKGVPENIYLIGNSLLWLPFIISAHAFTLMLNLFIPLQADGYTWPYQLSIGIASIFYGFLGIFLIYKLCRKFYPKTIALVATLTMWYGTSVLWYQAVEPSMSHINSLFLAAAFVYVWHGSLDRRTKRKWFALGAIAGLIYLVRQQDALLLALPATELAREFLSALKNRKYHQIKDAARKSALIVAGLLAVIAIQAAAWKTIYGQYVVYSYGNTAQLWTWVWPPQTISFIFSIEEGMLRIPAMVIGIAGLLLFFRKEKQTGALFLAVIGINVVVTSSWTGWNNGYGARFLIGMVPLMSLGMAAALQKFFREKPGLYIAAAGLIALNMISMAAFLLQEVGSKMN